MKPEIREAKMNAKAQPFMQFVAPGVRELHPYSPGMPVEELQRRLGVPDVIKLASNENPLGASPKVLEALAGANRSNPALYPDDSGYRLKAKLAKLHDIDPARIVLGNGSNVLLELVARIFLGPDHAAMFGQHAFAVYPLATLSQSAPAVVVPSLPADHAQPYGTDLDGFISRMTPDVAVVFIASPNNPTGTWNTPAELEAFLEAVPSRTVVVLDEAYFDFQAPELKPDSRAWLERFPNLIVMRTFSKAYGLAALRVGYSLSHLDMADLLGRVRPPFCNGTLALLAAETALDDKAHVAATVELTVRERARMGDALKAMGLRVLPSQANFLAVDFGRVSAPIHQALLERGIIVRPMSSYALPTFLRVSIGLESENDRFLQALQQILTA